MRHRISHSFPDEMNLLNVSLFIIFNILLCFPNLSGQPQPQTDELKDEAVRHMKNGRYGEAITLLNNYISARPQQAEGYNLRGLAYEYRGQYEESVYDLRSALKLEPNNSMIIENLNRVTKEWYKLIYNNIEGYKREIAIAPAKAVNYLQIGKSYKNLGQWEEAEIWYDKYLGMEKASPDEIIRYTEILAKNNHIAKGEPVLKKYTDEYSEDQRLWSRYGYFLLWLGKTKPAINAFEHALNLKPFFKEAMDGLARAKGNGYIYTFNDTATYRSYTYGIPRSFGYLIDNYFRKLKKNPDDNETRFNLINELLKVNRYEEAYQQMLILKEKEGETARVKSLMDEVVTAREKFYKEQIGEYEKLLQKNQGSKEILLKLAGYYSSLGNYIKAVELYSGYLAFHPEDTEVRFLYIQNAAWGKQYVLAGNELDVLIQQYPDSTKYKLLRAQIYVWLNQDLSEAENLLNDVLAKEPYNFNALLTMALLEYQKNDLIKADHYVSLAGNLSPTDQEIARLKFDIKKQTEINKEHDIFLVLEEARAKVSANDCYAAVSLFEKYNSLTSPDKNVLMEEVDAYLCIKDYESALQICDQLLSQSYDFNIQKKKAKILLWSNDPLTALDEFRKLNALRPEDSEVKMYVGDTYFQLKRYDEARNIYEKLLKETPGSKILTSRLSWFGEGGGNFLSFHFPSYFMVNPEGIYYFDNFDFKYSQQGLMLEAGINNYISIGISGSRGQFDSLNSRMNFYTVKGLISIKMNKNLSSGLSIGKTFFEKNQDIFVGGAYIKASSRIYDLGLDYISQDAAQIFYSPFLVNKRLKVETLRFNGDYHPTSGLLVSGFYSYYFVSDGNGGNNFQFRLGKKFDELAAGYEFYFLGFKDSSTLYYSPENLESHSVWGEWLIINNDRDELKLGGKIGIIPENNFILREIFASAKFMLEDHFALQGRITTGSSIRHNMGYSSTSFYIAAYWSF